MSVNNERGASAMLIALSMLVLMGFAAIAIDVSLAKNIRRQDQSAADFAALAAVQFAQPNTGCSGPGACVAQAIANGTAEAIAVANATLDDPALAVWADPAECGSPPPGFTVSASTNCVAFETGLQRAWVYIPIIESETTFGRLLGATEIDTTAVAIAQTVVNGGASNVLPLLTPGSVSGSDYDCLKTSGNPNWGDCANLPSTGNFGSGDFFLYKNDAAAGTPKCNGDTNGRLVSNIARGVDHPLGIHPTGVGAGIEENQACPVFGAEPDMVQGQSGVGSNLDQGLTRGGSSYSSTGPYPGRIQEAGPGPGAVKVRNAQGVQPDNYIDDTPLWSHLKAGLGAPCSKTDVDTPAEMVACINFAKSTGTEIFLPSIASSQRFGFTPLLYESDFSTPGTTYHIVDFLPVYLDSTFYGCNSSTCSIVHTPGVANSASTCPANPWQITCGVPGGGNQGLNAVTAYILDKTILPLVAKQPYPGDANQRTYQLVD